jgi:hypothetical protein
MFGSFMEHDEPSSPRIVCLPGTSYARHLQVVGAKVHGRLLDHHCVAAALGDLTRRG